MILRDIGCGINTRVNQVLFRRVPGRRKTTSTSHHTLHTSVRIRCINGMHAPNKLERYSTRLILQRSASIKTVKL